MRNVLPEEFKAKTTAAEDSSYIAQESEGGAVSVLLTMVRKNMIIADSTVFTAAKGTVLWSLHGRNFL
jgi:hypothetical protein